MSKMRQELLKEVGELMTRYYPTLIGTVEQVNVYFKGGLTVHIREHRKIQFGR